jgi:HAD superfamily hydrolase (TIGR01549 family)
MLPQLTPDPSRFFAARAAAFLWVVSHNAGMVTGIVFDLDGTLVDSRLDFDAMRREMELPPEMPILEALARLDPKHAARCNEILHRHELAGAQRATLLPGCRELIEKLHARGVKLAIATRNSRHITVVTVEKLAIPIDALFTRDDGPVKPHPWPVEEACRLWAASPTEVVIIGDFRFDIECGRAAGCRTVLLTHPHPAASHPNKEQADFLLTSLADYPRLLDWLRL